MGISSEVPSNFYLRRWEDLSSCPNSNLYFCSFKNNNFSVEVIIITGVDTKFYNHTFGSFRNLLIKKSPQLNKLMRELFRQTPRKNHNLLKVINLITEIMNIQQNSSFVNGSRIISIDLEEDAYIY
jgi:hypothetical protein